MLTTIPGRTATCLALLGLVSIQAVAQKLPRRKELLEIEGDRVYRVMAKDGIPAIDKPRFVPAVFGNLYR